MRIAVIGGTGEAGAPTVAALVRRGAQVVVVSRRPPAISGVEHRVADIATGEGLRAALEGAECVVHAANGRRNAAEVLIGGTERLFEAAEAAAVSHLAFISIVGCERVPFRYHRVKAEQERLIAASPVPWTVLRATQFHSLVASLFDATRRFGTLPGGAARL
nr:NAD(P)H-binding protein [Solirubrobacterales bacterium]